MNVHQQSKYGVIGFGHFTDFEMTQLSTYFYIPFLREILERMERESLYAVITLGTSKRSSNLDLTPLIHLSFVNYCDGYAEKEGLILAPRAPMPKSYDGELMIDRFLENNSEWFDEFPGYEPDDGKYMERTMRREP